MRFGVVILPEHRWPAARRLWERAELLGFDHAWTYDHLAWRTLRDGPWFGAVPTLSAAAVVTSRIRLGPLVASPNFRHPVPFAKEMVTLDDLSGGRLTIGLGAGGGGWDTTMLGQEPWPPRERADRFTEFVEVVDRLLTDPAASYDGSWYSAVEARTYPGCVQTPRAPLAIAATGPRGMALAARYADTWVTTGARAKAAPVGAVEGATDVAAQMSELDEACRAAGRDPSTLARLVLTGPVLDAGLTSRTEFEDTVGCYAEAGVTDFVVHWPRSEEPYAADLDTFEEIFAGR